MQKRPLLIVAGIAALITHLSFGVAAQTDPESDNDARIEKGRVIAVNGGKGIAACSSCHGSDGNGNVPGNFPRLAGMNQQYLEKQLTDYRSGDRVQIVMQSQARALTEDQVKAVAAYYASLPAKKLQVKTQQAKVEKGRLLALYGDWNRDIPACTACHGPQGRGLGQTFPSIAAQPPGYTAAQLKAWQKGDRDNDPNQLMKSVAARLTEDEIVAVAEYFATLSPKKGGSQ